MIIAQTPLQKNAMPCKLCNLRLYKGLYSQSYKKA